MKPVYEVLENLLELQRLDSQINAIRQCDQAPPDDLKYKSQKIEHLRLREHEKTKTFEELRSKRNKKKRALELCRQRIVKTELAIKEIKRAPDLQAKTNEIAQLKTLEQGHELKEQSVDKDYQILMAQILEIRGERASLESNVNAIASTQQQSKQEVALKIREIDSLKSQLIARTNVSYVLLYQRIFSTRSGLAISRVRGNACGACHMLLPAQFLIRLSQSPAVEQCPACSRILVPFRKSSRED